MKKLRLTLPSNSPRQKPRAIANEIRTAIFVGRLKPGDKLPSVREAAEDWDQTKDSVQRAYKLLREEGVLIDSDDRGTLPWFMVNPELKPPGEKERIERLDALIAQSLAQARKLGYSVPELEESASRMLAKIKRPARKRAAKVAKSPATKRAIDSAAKAADPEPEPALA